VPLLCKLLCMRDPPGVQVQLVSCTCRPSDTEHTLQSCLFDCVCIPSITRGVDSWQQMQMNRLYILLAALCHNQHSFGAKLLCSYQRASFGGLRFVQSAAIQQRSEAKHLHSVLRGCLAPINFPSPSKHNANLITAWRATGLQGSILGL